MGKKVTLSESELVNVVRKIVSEQSITDMESFGFKMNGPSKEEKSKKNKMDYFMNIYLPKFNEIKDTHGLDFTIALLNELAVMVDEVEED